jgi:hypothetical protein
MNKTECLAQYNSPLVQRLLKVTWQEYKKDLKKTKKVGKAAEKKYIREFKQGFLNSCTQTRMKRK